MTGSIACVVAMSWGMQCQGMRGHDCQRMKDHMIVSIQGAMWLSG